MSNGLMPWRLAAFGIVVACGGFFCAGRGGTQRAVLSEMDNLIGGGICQYPQQVHSCTDCVNDWECEDGGPGSLFSCQNYTGNFMYTCTLNAAGICSGMAWEVQNCVVYTGFFDTCPTQFNSYNLGGGSGGCT